MRGKWKGLVILGVAGVALGALPASANAAATDVAAIVTEAQDIAAASLNNSGQTLNDPNTTCTVKAIGDNLVQRENLLVAEVYTEDFGTATGTCASFDTSSYSATVTMALQAFYQTSATSGRWVTYASTSASANSIFGVAQPFPATLINTIVAPSDLLNRYHRVAGVLTTSRGQRFVDYSPLWFDTP